MISQAGYQPSLKRGKKTLLCPTFQLLQRPFEFVAGHFGIVFKLILLIFKSYSLSCFTVTHLWPFPTSISDINHPEQWNVWCVLTFHVALLLPDTQAHAAMWGTWPGISLLLGLVCFAFTLNQRPQGVTICWQLQTRKDNTFCHVFMCLLTDKLHLMFSSTFLFMSVFMFIGILQMFLSKGRCNT